MARSGSESLAVLSGCIGLEGGAGHPWRPHARDQIWIDRSPQLCRGLRPRERFSPRCFPRTVLTARLRFPCGWRHFHFLCRRHLRLAHRTRRRVLRAWRRMRRDDFLRADRAALPPRDAGSAITRPLAPTPPGVSRGGKPMEAGQRPAERRRPHHNLAIRASCVVQQPPIEARGAITELRPIFRSPNGRVDALSTLGGGATTADCGAWNAAAFEAFTSGGGATTEFCRAGELRRCVRGAASGGGLTTDVSIWGASRVFSAAGVNGTSGMASLGFSGVSDQATILGRGTSRFRFTLGGVTRVCGAVIRLARKRNDGLAGKSPAPPPGVAAACASCVSIGGRYSEG